MLRNLITFIVILLGILSAFHAETAAQTDTTSRDSPLPIGETVDVGDYEVKVVSVTPNALDIVMGENQFNDPPADGEQFFMVRLEATYVGVETGTPGWDLTYGSVGVNGRAYTDSGNSCGLYPDHPFDVGEMFPGAVAEFNVCWTIRSNDADSLVMFVEELLSFDDVRAWLSLSTEPAIPAEPSSVNTSSPEPTGRTTRSNTSSQSITSKETSREAPLPVGETIQVGDYEVRVIDVTPNANDIVVGENQFNDPPADGEQFFMVRLEATYVGVETGTPGWDLTYGSVGVNGRAYTDSGNSCGLYPDHPFDVGEMFPGAVAEFNVCWTIRSNDADSLVMFVEELLSFDDVRVWLDLRVEE